MHNIHWPCDFRKSGGESVTTEPHTGVLRSFHSRTSFVIVYRPRKRQLVDTRVR